MSEPEHSVLAPSSAGIWGKPGGCPGYVTTAQKYPELEETQDSRDGTAAHWVAAEMLERWRATNDLDSLCYVGSVAPNGVEITEEMQEAAEMFFDDVMRIVRACGRALIQHGVEERVYAPQVHEQSHGTPDAWIYDRAHGTLWVWDFKFGMGYVSEYENWQLINYYAGLVNALGIDGHADQYLTVRMRIVQPRAYGHGGPVREWRVMGSDLRAHINILHNAAAEAMGPNPTYRSGSHCRYCPARGGRCPAAYEAGVNLYEAATQSAPSDVTPEDVGVLLGIVERAAEQIDYIKTGLEAQAEQYMRQGQNVPGRVVETVRGRLSWDRSAEEVIALGRMLQIDLEKPPTPITPTKAKKLGIDSAIINEYCTERVTGVKIAKVDTAGVSRIFKSTGE